MFNYNLFFLLSIIAIIALILFFGYLVLSDSGGLKIIERIRILRDSESTYLPYFLYDKENNSFINDDGSINYIWECIPAYFSSVEIVDGLNILLDKTIIADKQYYIQFISIADTDVDSFFTRYEQVRNNNNPLTQENTIHSKDFFTSAQAQKKLSKRVKNFKLYVVLSLQVEVDKEVINEFEFSLSSAQLYPKMLSVNEALSVIRKTLGITEQEDFRYDNTQFIRDQLIPISTSLTVDKKKGILKRTNADGEETFISTLSLISTTGINERLDSIELNTLLGGYLSNTETVNCKIVVTMTVLDSHNIIKSIESKASHFYRQEQTKKSNFKTGSKRAAYDDFFINAEKENPKVYYYTIAVHSQNETSNKNSRNDLIKLFKRNGFTLDVETILTQVMFYNTLPFRFIYDQGILAGLLRHLIAPSRSVAALTPHQSDYKGNYLPALALVGRKGQMVGFNLYGENIVNHNFLCTGGSGKGKSVLMNMIIESLLAINVKVRIVDLGDSYKRLCKLFDGVYIDISDEKICLNPFPFDIQHLEEKEITKNLVTTANVISEMAYASNDKMDVDALESQILLQAVKAAYYDGNILYGINSVISYCQSSENFTEKNLAKKAKELAFLLKEFATDGIYGNIFNGIPSLNYKDERLVILEAESLKSDPVLFKIVTFQVLNQMTQNIYRGERGSKEAIIFEEAANLFMDSVMLKNIIEEAYRRVRKYGGSFGVVTQSILDTQSFGDVGRVIVENSGTKLFLASTGYEEAMKKNIISYKGIAKELLLDVKTKIPMYSEVFIDQEDIVGIGQLPLSNYQYAMTTSKDADVAAINNLIEKNNGDVPKSLKEFADEMDS